MPARNNGRARTALESVHEHLFTDHGIVLQQPAYTRYHLELGEITSYPPGYKENAGIFCHNNTWIHLGWCLLGDGDRALEYYHSICPSTQADIDTYRAEPYVYAQMIAGRDAATPGEAKNSWLTGTAAWTFVTLAQGILGIKPGYDGLRIDPCIPRRLGLVQCHPAVPRRHVRDHGLEPGRRLDRRALTRRRRPRRSRATSCRSQRAPSGSRSRSCSAAKPR